MMPAAVLRHPRATLHHGDSREILRSLPDESVDAIVTDPPYELGFMGKGWDRSGIAYDATLWAECLRVLKPGGHMVAFSATRTYHRMACAVEDAGFDLRDQLAWVYGSGFPKSHNGEWGGTALKPAWEPIALARKPLIGSVAVNWRTHGTGGLNIDACRVPIDASADADAVGQPLRRGDRNDGAGWGMNKAGASEATLLHAAGRWPANILHDGSEEVEALFPEAAGARSAITGEEPSGKTRDTFGLFGERTPATPRGDTGRASRFFYCGKATRQDRDEGLEHFPERITDVLAQHRSRRMEEIRRPDGAPPAKGRNPHPTVKPTAVMRWLVRLVTPAGGIVLDPFTGSGSTGKAAILEGCSFQGIELTPDYVPVAWARIQWAIGEPLEAIAA